MSWFNNTKKWLDKKCCGQLSWWRCLTCPALQKKLNNTINKLSLNLQNTEWKSWEATDTNKYYESQEFQNMIESCSS